jgi:peroxiredoxin
MIKAASRFPNYSPIQKLKDETIEYVKIFEEEYNVGDQLPTFSLPDESGIPFYTQSLKGKYVLMNFWSTWCPQCFNYMEAERKVKDKYPSSKIEVISVAIDNEKDVWKQIIAQRKYDWKQLIDEDMWQGRTVKALKFDSIPFNFLISPEGKVLAKAIKPDSMLIVLSQKVK